jgi:hypothetical protein
VQQKSIVAVLVRWPAKLEPAEVVFEAVVPRLDRKRRISHGKVEGRQLPAFGELRAGDGVTLADVGIRAAVQDHVHLRQRPGGVVLFLAVNRDASRCLTGRFE